MTQGLTKAVLLGSLSLATTLGAGGQVAAHPHVWVDVSNVFVLEDGRVSAVRAEWTFDALFSAYAVSGLDADGDGTHSATELEPLVDGYLTNLAEYDYFMELSSGGALVGTETAAEGTAEMRDGRLVFSFTLPLADPVDPGLGDLELRTFDPTYYVALEMRDEAPVRLAAEARSDCETRVDAPDGTTEWQTLADAALGDTSMVRSVAARHASVVRLVCAP